MKKLIAISILALFMLCMNALATETRTLTLGQTNNVLIDEANIWLYPSRILDYPTLAVGEFGYDPATGDEDVEDFTRFGIHFKIGRDNPFVLGGYFDNAPALVPTNLFGDELVPFDSIPLDNRRINLFYGNTIGGLNFGLRLGLLQSSRTTESDGDDPKEELHYYDVNAGLTADDGAWDVAAKVAFGGFTDEDATGDPETDDDGLYDLGINGRMFYTINPNYTLIPHVGLAYSKRGIKTFDGGEETETETNSATTLQLGTGINYVPATNVLAVVDFGIVYDKRNQETNFVDDEIEDGEENLTNLWLPYFKLGLDADVFRWMDIRLGATSIWNRRTDEDVLIDTKDKWNYADNETYLGFGFHWNRLHIDTYTDPQLFLNGFNFLSGSENNMNFQISAVYEMM